MPVLPQLALLALLLSTAESREIPYTLVSAGRTCTNDYREVSPGAGSPDACAELVCADPLCGTFFQDRSSAGGSCSCLAAGMVCTEILDTGSNRYEITDTSGCEPKEAENHDCFAMVYEMGDFTGRTASFPEGSFGAEDFAAYGAAEDGISAVYISGEGCHITVYGNSDFTGWSATFSEGSFSAEDLAAGGAKIDDISSLVVHYGELADQPGPQEGVAAGLPAAQADAASDAAAGDQRAPPAPPPVRKSPKPPPAPKRRPPPPPSTVDVVKPRWAAEVPAERWLDIPRWARKYLVDEFCEPKAKANCDEAQVRFIDQMVRNFCEGECLKWTHRDNLEDEAKRVSGKRMNVKPVDRPSVEKKVAVLWSMAMHITEKRDWDALRAAHAAKEEL